MRCTPNLDSTRTRSTGEVDVGPGPPAIDLSEVRATLDQLASDLRSLWSSAVEHGDFHETARLVVASHAVHRAAIALRPDSLLLVR